MTNQFQEKTFSTDAHTLSINEAGIVLVESRDGRGWCVRLEPREALFHAEYLLAHRGELEQLQKHLEQIWIEIAEEVEQRFEAQNEDGTPFVEATAADIRCVLESVSGTNMNGSFVEEPISRAGYWYRSLWNKEGSDTTTYEQQWLPFLRMCRLLQEKRSIEQKRTHV